MEKKLYSPIVQCPGINACGVLCRAGYSDADGHPHTFKHDPHAFTHTDHHHAS